LLATGVPSKTVVVSGRRSWIVGALYTLRALDLGCKWSEDADTTVTSTTVTTALFQRPSFIGQLAPEALGCGCASTTKPTIPPPRCRATRCDAQWDRMRFSACTSQHPCADGRSPTAAGKRSNSALSLAITEAAASRFSLPCLMIGPEDCWPKVKVSKKPRESSKQAAQ
jgi:hypothetical protein